VHGASPCRCRPCRSRMLRTGEAGRKARVFSAREPPPPADPDRHLDVH
jgi:hypothetical protein